MSSGADCTYALCGNGVVNAGEQCDDGNTDNNDGCDTTCAYEVPECALVALPQTALTGQLVTFALENNDAREVVNGMTFGDGVTTGSVTGHAYSTTGIHRAEVTLANSLNTGITNTCATRVQVYDSLSN